ncbi:MAG: hypothetical protein V1855_00790 [bacterium]
MKISKNILFIMVLLGLCSNRLDAWANTNFFRTDDFLVQHTHVPQKKFLFGANLETGGRSTGLDASSNRQSVLAIHDRTQSVVSMLLNNVADVHAKLPVTQPQLESTGVMLPGYPVPITDPGDAPAIGRLKFSGDYDQTDVTFLSKYGFVIGFIPGTFNLSLYVPFIKKEISDFQYKDLTQEFEPARIVLKNTVIDNLVQNVEQYGNLHLKDGHLSGLGDSLCMLEWCKIFEPEGVRKKTWGKKKDSQQLWQRIALLIKGGFLVPTGKSAHEDNAFGVSLGHDDTWGFPGSVGLDVAFNDVISFGLNLDFLYLFDKSKVRRLKTNKGQTDFLLLSKGRATKRNGLTWRLSSYARLFEFFRRWFFKVSYQFIKHQEDRLVPLDSRFKNEIINTSKSLEEWDSHNVGFHIEYSSEKYAEHTGMIPHIGFFYKFPLTGNSVIDMHTFGAHISFSF